MRLLLNILLFIIFSVLILISSELYLKSKDCKKFKCKDVKSDIFLISDFLKSNQYPIDYGVLKESQIIIDTIPKIDKAGSASFSYKYKINGARFSGSVPDSKIGDINLYGCSFSFGLGLNDSNTMAYYIQKHISEYEINNFGVSGYGMFDIYNKIKSTVDSTTKVVIINYAHFLSDRLPGSRYYKKMNCSAVDKLNKSVIESKLTLKTYKYSKERILEDTVFYKFYIPLPFQTKSCLINKLDDVYCGYIERKIKKKREISLYIFDQILKLCQNNDINLIVTNIDGYSLTHKDLNFIKQVPIEVLDLKVNAYDLEYNLQPDDTHPNKFANQKYAQKILAYLKSNVL